MFRHRAARCSRGYSQPIVCHLSMVRGAAITIRIPGEAGFQGAPGCFTRDWIFVHTPGLPLASFAVSRDFLVLGEQCLTRRARSREGCSVPSRSPFAPPACFRVSLRYREGITSHAKSAKPRRMCLLLTIGTLRASRVIFQYRERTMSHAKPRKNVEILVIAPQKRVRAPSGEGGLLHW